MPLWERAFVYGLPLTALYVGIGWCIARELHKRRKDDDG
jgi:hypothetical protein